MKNEYVLTSNSFQTINKRLNIHDYYNAFPYCCSDMYVFLNEYTYSLHFNTYTVLHIWGKDYIDDQMWCILVVELPNWEFQFHLGH